MNLVSALPGFIFFPLFANPVLLLRTLFRASGKVGLTISPLDRFEWAGHFLLYFLVIVTIDTLLESAVLWIAFRPARRFTWVGWIYLANSISVMIHLVVMAVPGVLA